MNNKDAVKFVFNELEPIVSELDLYVYDVTLVKEGPNLYLRIFVDRDEGVTIDDCVKVSRKIELILDEKDPIKDQYILEVSSPGIDRTLTSAMHFNKYINEIVDVKLFKNLNNQKEFQGKLNSYDEENKQITLLIEENEIKFELKDIAICKLSLGGDYETE